jgi:hypothetical protein
MPARNIEAEEMALAQVRHTDMLRRWSSSIASTEKLMRNALNGGHLDVDAMHRYAADRSRLHQAWTTWLIRSTGSPGERKESLELSRHC